MSDGAIIIRQLGYEGVAMSDVLRALPERDRSGDRVGAELDHRDVFKRAVETRDWAQAQRQTLAGFDQFVAPLLQAHPNYGVHFFGTSSIPLMMLLGLKVSTWRTVTAYNHHHTRKDWTWDSPAEPAPTIGIDLDGLPTKPSRVVGDVVVRVSVSYPVDPHLTRVQVSLPIAEVDIGVDSPSLDVLVSPGGVEAVARRFREALDEIQKRLPNASTVHVFAAVPPGVAFHMGAWISETMHARIQGYQFERKGATSGYYPAFILQQPVRPTFVPSNAEVLTLERERAIWQEELEHLQAMVATLKTDPKPWLDEVGTGTALCAPPRWWSLPSPRTLHGMKATIDLAVRDVPGAFLFDPTNGRWQLADSLLLPLLRRLPDEARRRRAARLFLLHECLHEEHLLTNGTAPGIGRFGKLLEEADYQADAWALLYNHRYEAGRSAIADAPAFFREAMHVAVETMMAFDDAEGVMAEMQARRISRYLLWTWQLLELERCSTFDACCSILCDKPIIELAGLRSHVADRRLISSLRPAQATDLEVAVLRDGQIRRFAQGPAARLDLVLEGLREHKFDQIRDALRAIADAVIPALKA